MASTALAEPAKTKSCYYIVDADAHVNPPHDMWADYLPDALKDQAPVIEHGDDADYVIFEGNRRKVNLISAQAGRAGKDFKMHGRVSDARSGGWMPRARLEDMDTDGMDAAILFGGGPLGSGNPALYLESFAAYNRWLSDFCHADPARLAGVGYVPMTEVDLAVKMVREFPRLGLKAVNIPAFPMKTGGPGLNAATAQTTALTGDHNSGRCYADAEFDPFWAACCELGIPVTIHLGGRGVRYNDKKWFLPDLVMSKLAMAEPITIMIFGGVFDRFPELKLASIESGVGWFAFIANYMDETWHKQRYWVDSAILNEPSHYMDRNVFGSFIHDRVGIETRHMRGAKNIMWSSDYPHSETTYPDSLKKIEQLFAGVPEAEVREIVGGRARALYNL